MRRLFNDNWKFYEAAPGTPESSVRACEFRPVDIPHDALINDAQNLYRDCDLWYTRALQVSAEQLSGAVILEFGGVYMDCDIRVNGVNLYTHRYGYTSFSVDITSGLRPGDNELCVMIRHRQPSGRWYTGAGIYRDVYINYVPEAHIEINGLYITTTELENGKWSLRVNAESSAYPIGHVLKYADGNVKAAFDQTDAQAEITLDGIIPWDCENPYLYTLESSIPGQTVSQKTGFRTVEFTTDSGMLLNHRHVKLKGVCLHHDQGALGSAFFRDAERRRLRIMQEMGANALRTTHYPPDPQVLELCDEMGILVVDEAFDIWRRPKGAYDYSRFFDECWKKDVALWVRRDRNHPSVIMWSIGNEILDTNTDESAQLLTRQLADEVRLHDPDSHGAVTIGSNFMPWENAQKCADHVEIQGYNYGEKYYQPHHEAHPGWVIYGSETASLLSSRGIYHFPMGTNVLSDDDQQCSALGNSCTSWGTQDMRKCLTDDLNNRFSLGQFLWSGTDYIGEPTPYHTRCCYFGMTDTACFPKDTYYRVKAAWNDEPMAHIGVSWDWNVNQLIDVPVMTNAASCELFLNGKSLGIKQVDRYVSDLSLPVWQVPFEKGVLHAVCRGKDGSIVAEDTVSTPGETAALRLSADATSLRSDGRSLVFIEITALDESGNEVPNACDSIHVAVSGCGRLMGLDNGDSDSPEEYLTDTRRLFSGKLLAVIASDGNTGPVTVTASAPGVESRTIIIPVTAVPVTEGASCSEQKCRRMQSGTEKHARRVDIEAPAVTVLTPETPSVTLRARLLPEESGGQEITWSCVTAAGIPSPCAQITALGDTANVQAVGDGEIFIRASVQNMSRHPRVISMVRLAVEGFGAPDFCPYEFISAGLYTAESGITPGNERGISFSRDSESWAEYARVDFGKAGSDTVTLPVFALNGDPYSIALYANGEHIADLPYQKECIWNVYQPETYKLPVRLTGMQTLRFVLDKKVHLKGFVFERQSRAAQRLTASQADRIYGDSYTAEGTSVRGIGNNVTLEFDEMDFGEYNKAVLELDGFTPLEMNPVTVHFTGSDGSIFTQLVSFRGGESGVQRFILDVPGGVNTVGFVFLPGSNFDFNSIAFTQFE